MKFSRKALSLVLIVLLLLAGCAKQEAGTLSETTVFTQSTTPTVQPEAAAEKTAPTETENVPDADGQYTSKEDVALYLHIYGELPSNFITKKQAQKLGWEGGDLWRYAEGKSIGGDRFGNYEGMLPEDRDYKECDIDYRGGKRNAKRIVFSADGLIYYTGDHYESFELLYGEE